MESRDNNNAPSAAHTTRAKTALELENLKSIQATHDINKKFSAEKAQLVADCNRRGVLLSGGFIKKVTELEVRRATQSIEQAIELRRETLLSAPEVGSEEEFKRLIESLYRLGQLAIRRAAEDTKKYGQRVPDRTNDAELSPREEAEIRRLKDFAKSHVDVLRKEMELTTMHFTRSVRVTLVRAAGSASEKQVTDVEMGGDLNTEAIFRPDVDIKRGDEIRCPDVFDEVRIAVRVVTETYTDGTVSQYTVTMQPLSEYRERQRLLTQPYSVQQNFHGAVGKVAGRDIVENNVTSITLLTLLERAVRESEEIPEEDKASILQQLQRLIENPYVSGIASGAILEGIKTLFT